MKIVIVHGEHLEASRKRFSTIIEKVRERGMEVVEVDTEASFPEQIVSSSLFGGESLFVVDEAKKLVKKEVEWLKKNFEDLGGNLLIYSRGNIPAWILKGFSDKAKIERFDIPKLIFKLMERIYPGNSGEVIKSLYDIVRHEAIEFVFVMIANHFRDLYWVESSPSSIPYPSWRVARLENQAGKFKKGQIKKIIGKLAQIDMKVKTSRADLRQELDLLMASELE